jgi:uncharacterized membrane protein YfcA
MLAYSFAILIGLSLGLLGGGGSILTVPVLVYALGMDPKTAIALSLAIVGATSLIGVVNHYKNKNIDFKVALLFGPIAMLGTFIGAKLSQFMSASTQLLLFAVIMILAAYFMYKPTKLNETKKENKNRYFLIIAEGLIVGIITGIVGVGGGFLIVPALVLLSGLDMKKAVGTSLLIIAAKSFSGFAGYIGIVEIPWNFLASFTAFSGAGIIIGSALMKYIAQDKLKKAFAVFLVFMGIFVIYKQLS